MEAPQLTLPLVRGSVLESTDLQQVLRRADEASHSAAVLRHKAERLAKALAVREVDRELDKHTAATGDQPGTFRKPVQGHEQAPGSVHEEQKMLDDAQRAYRKAQQKVDATKNEQRKLKGAIERLLRGEKPSKERRSKLAVSSGIKVKYTLQKLPFGSDPNNRQNRQETTVEERKRFREDEKDKYRYKWDERQPKRKSGWHDSWRGRRWQGKWAHTRGGRRYWRAHHDPRKARRPARLSPYKGGRWPLRDRRLRDRYRKYHVIPQHYPHKDLADLGDNIVSGLRDSWNRAGPSDGAIFQDRFKPYARPLNATRTPSLFRPFTPRATRKRSRLAGKGTGDLTGPTWRRTSGYGYRKRPLSRAMRRIERGSLLGPRARSRFWRDARSPHRSPYRSRPRTPRGPRSRGSRSPRDPRSWGRRSYGPRPPRTALGNPFDSRFVPRKVFMRQFHPRETTLGHPERVDRFRPLSNFPNFGKARNPADPEEESGTESPHGSPPPVLGQKTPAEKGLLDGKLDGKTDPFGIEKGLTDAEEPEEPLLRDLQDDNFNHKPGGDPLTDALQNSWDMHNGVADP